MTRSVLLFLLGLVAGASGALGLNLLAPDDSGVIIEPSTSALNGSACVDDASASPINPTAQVDLSSYSQTTKRTGSTAQAELLPKPENRELTAKASSEPAAATADPSSVDSSNLPEKFKYLVEPNPSTRRRLTPQENHAFFSQDSRDEAWAYTMELGIQEYLASHQSANGTIIEYVECRSRMCEIAGVVYPGGENDFDEHLEAMRGSGWWQLSNSQHSTGTTVDGEYRFVSFIPRNDEDTLVADIAASICE